MTEPVGSAVPKTPPFRRVLIANRGEIARRILWAARELGIGTVGVYSEADANLPHLGECDATVCIGPPPAAESYLNVEKLIAAAKETGCDCVHPGYGFLAENATAARKFEAAGITWIGPNPDAMQKMGDKIDAKTLMISHGVPTVPGFIADMNDPDGMRNAAEDCGFPLLIKASAGGGGKGMIVVRNADELLHNLKSVSDQAEKAFGAGGLLVERFLERPRHIEVQVLADTHGTTVHLNERECSIQRRHQKLIEEAPSPVVTPELRARICGAGVAAAQAAGYTSAGTVEFLFDETTGEFFFLEMNTRLQVEHPVTEFTTRIDICQAMFRIAAGEKLWFAQADVPLEGHAIECRIIAEDPFNGFMPGAGMLREFTPPTGPGVRCDAGFASGVEVSPHYDSLLAKLITWAPDRSQAILRMQHALDDFHIVGPQSCIPFHQKMMRDADYVAGHMTVHTAENKLKDGLMTAQRDDRDDAAVLVAALEALGAKPAQPHGRAGGGSAAPAATAVALTNEQDAWRLSGRARR